MSRRRWREARQEQERDIKETLQRNGMTEREASKVAEERSRRGMERAVNMDLEEGGRPPEL